MLTDHEDKVLHNLRDCVAANSSAAPDGNTASMPSASVTAHTTDAVAEMHDPEDAEPCDDLDDFFAGDPAQEPASQIPRNTAFWNIVSPLTVHTSGGLDQCLLHAVVQAACGYIRSVGLQDVLQNCQI